VDFPDYFSLVPYAPEVKRQEVIDGLPNIVGKIKL
jgi:hypothetical protein